MKFLKTRFKLTENGGVIRRVNPRGIAVMRRKLKTFKRWVDSGRITPKDVETSYRSWQGHIKRCNSFNTMENMRLLYNKLFNPPPEPPPF
jgi:hypothetical protein